MDKASRRRENIDNGALIRSAREKCGKKLKDVSAESGFSLGYLAQLERGDIERPSPRVIRRVAVSVGIDVAELLGLYRYDDGVAAEAEKEKDKRRAYTRPRTFDPREDWFIEAQRRLIDAFREKSEVRDKLIVALAGMPASGSDALDEALGSLSLHAVDIAYRVAWPPGSPPGPIEQVGLIALIPAREAVPYFAALRWADVAEAAAQAVRDDRLRRSHTIQAIYARARMYQSLSECEIAAGETVRDGYALEAVRLCEEIAQIVETEDRENLHAREKALWPAALSIHAAVWRRYCGRVELRKRETGPGVRDRSLRDWLDEVPAAVADLHEKALEGYMLWIDELSSLRPSPHGDPINYDRLAKARLRLAILHRGLAQIDEQEPTGVRARPELTREALYAVSREQFATAINMRRELAMLNLPNAAVHRHDLARYHREYGLSLWLERRPDAYAQASWQFEVAGQVDGSFKDYGHNTERMYALRATIEQERPPEYAAVKREINLQVSESDFDRLIYDIVLRQIDSGQH